MLAPGPPASAVEESGDRPAVGGGPTAAGGPGGVAAGAEGDFAAISAELDATRAWVDELLQREGEAHSTRRADCEMLEDILRRQRGRLMELGFTYGDFKPPLERTVGHYAMAFDRNTDLLERLPARITARLDAEGRSAGAATAEYVLACYRSRDAGFPMEPVLEGILCETEEEAAAVRLEVNPVARQVAQMFSAEEDEASTLGEQAGTSGASPEASLSPEPSVE